MKRMDRAQTHDRAPKGSLLVCVLVCMGIALSISLTAVHASLRERRQATAEWQMEQTRWAADAGLSHALADLAANREYRGEEIVLELGGTPTLDAKVNVVVHRDKQSEEPISISATASLTTDHKHPVITQHTMECLLQHQN